MIIIIFGKGRKNRQSGPRWDAGCGMWDAGYRSHGADGGGDTSQVEGVEAHGRAPEG